jgi:hypothetical protein
MRKYPGVAPEPPLAVADKVRPARMIAPEEAWPNGAVELSGVLRLIVANRVPDDAVAHVAGGEPVRIIIVPVEPITVFHTLVIAELLFSISFRSVVENWSAITFSSPSY